MGTKKTKKVSAAVAIASALLFYGTAGWAQPSLVQEVTEGCKEELSKYCSQVTPGEGRTLACLYAHGDKLSGRCEFALYDAAAQLERAVAALSYVANECDEDLESLCAGVEAGEGRLAACLNEAGDKVSARCREAMADVGLAKK